MAAPFLPTLMKMRILVGYLGERASFAWWPTSFYESTSRSFLEPVFVKTHRAARYHGVLEAARRVHDEHLSVGSFHLFRLPEEIEQSLYATTLSGANELTLPQSKDEALRLLTELATPKATTSSGPMAVGHIRDLESPETLKTIAGAYLSAFTQNARSYPYLSA